jgi:hypothetical protein
LRELAAKVPEWDRVLISQPAFDVIETWYRFEDTGVNYDLRGIEDSYSALASNPELVLSETRLTLVDDPYIIDWARSCFNFLSEQYWERRIPGDSVSWGLATFSLLMFSPAPRNFLDIGQRILAQISNSNVDHSNARLPACLDPAVYMSSPEMSISELVVCGVRTAQVLQRLGDDAVKSAQKQCVCELFFEDLFRAAAPLLAAWCLHRSIQASAQRRAGEISNQLRQVLQEGAAAAVVCEEYLAHIGTSLWHATLSREDAVNLGEFDLTDRLQFEDWLEMNATRGPRNALESLTDSYIRLNIPRFLLALGKSVVNINERRQLEKTKTVLEDIASRLEATLPIAAILSEHDFIRMVYRLHSDVCHSLGLDDDSKTSGLRATDEYLGQRLENIQSAMADGTSRNLLDSVLSTGKPALFYEGTD